MMRGPLLVLAIGLLARSALAAPVAVPWDGLAMAGDPLGRDYIEAAHVGFSYYPLPDPSGAGFAFGNAEGSLAADFDIGIQGNVWSAGLRNIQLEIDEPQESVFAVVALAVFVNATFTVPDLGAPLTRVRGSDITQGGYFEFWVDGPDGPEARPVAKGVELVPGSQGHASFYLYFQYSVLDFDAETNTPCMPGYVGGLMTDDCTATLELSAVAAPEARGMAGPALLLVASCLASVRKTLTSSV